MYGGTVPTLMGIDHANAGAPGALKAARIPTLTHVFVTGDEKIRG